MAGGPFNANAYSLHFYIFMDRKHGRISFDTFPLDAMYLDMPVSDFVAWCRGHGVKLRTKIVGTVYYLDFRDNAARDLFRATWIVEANLRHNAMARRPDPYGEAA